MFARLTRARIKVDRIDEFIRLYEESVIPAAKSQKGYSGAYLLVDRQSGEAICITLWESEKDALANEESRYYLEQVAKFVNFYARPPIREGYEVSVRA